MRYFLLSIMIAISATLLSQAQDIKFKHYTTIDGLSQNSIQCIYQDSIGFIWLGTGDGLNRFDGYEFKVYLPDPSNPHALGHGSINRIMYKSTYELWITTGLGVYIYNRITDSFKQFKYLKYFNVSSIITDNDGFTWFGTNKGLYCFNPTDSTLQTFQYLPFSNQSLSNNQILDLFIDSKQNLWIETADGLNKYNSSSRTFQRYYHQTERNLPNQNLFHSIVEDKLGRLWVGSAMNRLDILNPEITDPSKNPFTLVNKGSISRMLLDSRNVLWIGKGSGDGVNLLNLNTFKPGETPDLHQLRNSPNFSWSISNNSIICIFEDKDKDIWVGTYGDGLNYYSRRCKKFFSEKQIPDPSLSISNNHVNVFFEDENYLWIGNEISLDRMNKKDRKFTHFNLHSNKSDSKGAAVYDLFKDSRGDFWCGTWAGGLNKYNCKTQTFQNYTADGNPGSLSSANIFTMNEDKEGNLWIGTIGGGVNIYNPKTNKFTQYSNIPGDSSSLQNNSVNHICVTRSGEIYLSTYSSFEHFDNQTKTFTHYMYNPQKANSLSNGSTMAIFEDSQGNIWVATSAGLELFDKEWGTFKHFTTKDGLPSNFIQGILEDKNQNLWISTNKGLSKFIKGAMLPKKPVFQNYTQDDGLPCNEFTARSVYKNQQGKMYFGTTNGYVYFNPENIEQDPIAPKIVITSFVLLNNEPDRDLRESINLLNSNSQQELDLKYAQSDFTIKFAALNYLNTPNSNFRYRLQGYEENWHYVKNKREATYTNIQPGEYTFMVDGSNSDGLWSQAPSIIKIRIHSPWWGTLAFKIAMILFIIVLIIAVYWMRFRMVEQQKIRLEKTIAERTEELVKINSLLEQRQEEITIQNEELSEHRNNLENRITERTAELELAKSKAEESDRLKSAFLANMSHEIRTPMNAIVGFASLLQSTEFSDEEKHTFIETINKNSETLLVLIDDILDISIIESNQLKLTRRKFDLVTILAEIESYYHLKNKKNIRIQFERKNNLQIINDPIRFRQIVNNLINNAIKYTDEGHILFGYEAINNEVRFYVTDTGIGIDPENHKNIFNHFFKIEKDNDKLYRGTGIGLAICKKLVELMGGKIWVESTPDIGSTFYFTLPLNRQVIPKAQELKETKLITSLKGIKILIAEDEVDNFRLIQSILKSYQPDITWVKNGREAVNIVPEWNNNENNCLILMDIKMPVMNGIDAARLIKENHNRIPIIAVTAYALPDDKNLIHQEKFDEYISKPFKQEELIAVISKFIS
ncbi:MAG TPA: two-component regulator propeller domain-containing protein [Bacteroidales bacterium]|nr:two-component regulator propeller domain-containing protein [Bacteroidales bacterium]